MLWPVAPWPQPTSQVSWKRWPGGMVRGRIGVVSNWVVTDWSLPASFPPFCCCFFWAVEFRMPSKLNTKEFQVVFPNFQWYLDLQQEKTICWLILMICCFVWCSYAWAKSPEPLHPRNQCFWGNLSGVAARSVAQTWSLGRTCCTQWDRKLQTPVAKSTETTPVLPLPNLHDLKNWMLILMRLHSLDQWNGFVWK